MKKSFFGFGAKVAMAVLAVCSFVLTSCYEKQAPVKEEAPVYYVVGTVYDATTSSVIADANVTVNGAAVTLSNGSFTSKIAGPGAVAVAAEAEGYVAVSRTVQVVAVGNNQTSVTTADLAMVPVEVPLPEPPVSGVKNGTLTAEDLVKTFGFPENVEVLDEGKIVICNLLDVEAHNVHNVHFGLDAHTSYTHDPYEITYKVYNTGYIWDFESVKDVIIDGVVETVCNAEMKSAVAGKKLKDLKTKEVSKVLNENGDKCLLSYYIDYTFQQKEITYVFDGQDYVVNCVAPVDVKVWPVYDDDHNLSNSHNFHGADKHDAHNHSTSNAGGGVVEGE